MRKFTPSGLRFDAYTALVALTWHYLDWLGIKVIYVCDMHEIGKLQQWGEQLWNSETMKKTGRPCG